MSQIGGSTYYEYPTEKLNFRKYDKYPDNQKWTRDYDDQCYVDCRANTSRRPLRYITRNFHDLGLNPNSLQFPGFLPQDGEGVHPSGIDVDSDLRFSQLTNMSFPQQLQCLPVPTIPLLQKGCLDVTAEMELRGKDTYGDKTCKPQETTFYERSFQIFDHLGYNPNDVNKSVYPDCNQTGIDTRHLHVEPYRNGVNCTGLKLSLNGGARAGNCSFRQTYPYVKNRYDKFGNRYDKYGVRYDTGVMYSKKKPCKK